MPASSSGTISRRFGRRVYWQLARQALFRLKVGMALRLWVRGLRFDGRYAPGLLDLAGRLRQLGDRAGELSVLSVAVGLAPELGWGHYHLGKTLAEQGDETRAIAHYRQATERLPHFFWGWQDLGEALFRQRDYEGAARAFEAAGRLNPGNSWTQHHRGRCLELLGDRDGALAAYDRAVALDDRFAWNHYNRAELLTAAERWGEAIEAYCRAAECQPDLPYLSRKLLHALQQQTDIDVAATAARLGASAKASGSPDLTGELLALAARPDDAHLHRRLAERLRDRGDELQAAVYEQIARQLDREPVAIEPPPTDGP